MTDARSSATIIEQIVTHLNQPPYELNLRLVDFAENKPIELIEILLLVFRSIDTNDIDHDENDNDNDNDNANSSGIETNARLYLDNVKAVQKKLVPFISILDMDMDMISSSNELNISTRSTSNINVNGINSSSDSQEDHLNKLASSIAAGDANTIHPILLHCLTNQESLKEKVHLTPFLTPIQIPLHITMTQPQPLREDATIMTSGLLGNGSVSSSGALLDLARCYEGLQEEFKGMYDSFKVVKKKQETLMGSNSTSNSNSNRNDIGASTSANFGENDLKALQDEKNLLLVKIGEMEDRMHNENVHGQGGRGRDGRDRGHTSRMNQGDVVDGSSMSSFQMLLEATSSLRREQAKEARLAGKMIEQEKLLEATEVKLRQAQNRHESIRALIGQDDDHDPISVDASGEFDIGHGQGGVSVLDGIRREVAEVAMNVRSTLVSERGELENEINLLRKEFQKPIRTEGGLEQVIATREQLHQECYEKSDLLEQEKSKDTYRKIAMFQKHASVSATRLKGKEISVQNKRDQMKTMEEELKRFKAKLFSMTENKRETHNYGPGPIELPNGDVLRGREIQQYLKKCKDTLAEEDARKGSIKDLEADITIIDKTISDLEAKHGKEKDLLREREEKAGVKGYHETQERLQVVQRDAEEVNRVKGETLQEISDIVTEMTETLAKERENLQPMITDLKSRRTGFKKIKSVHDSKKSRYDKLATKLASERHYVEQECERLQDEWKQAERNYHYLLNANEAAKANLEKAAMEEKCRNGEEQMLPDFKCLQDFYEHKLDQEENLAKQLRIEQRYIKENEKEHIRQVQLFSRLQKLMQLKKCLRKREMRGMTSSSDNGEDDDSDSYNLMLENNDKIND